MVVERLLMAIALFSVGVVVFQLYTRRQRQQAAHLAATDPLLAKVSATLPTVVYFYTPTCAPCTFQQSPALDRLAVEVGGEVQIVRVDASKQVEDAERWGVLTVPTTFVIGAGGKTNAINYGFAPIEQLKTQLAA